MASSVYTDTGVRITDDIDDARFAVLYSKLSVTCNSSSHYNNSNITDTGELFSGLGSGYEWQLSDAGHNGGFWPKPGSQISPSAITMPSARANNIRAPSLDFQSCHPQEDREL